jgi:hypothetical protein
MKIQLRKFYNADDMSFGGLFDDDTLSAAVEKTETTRTQNPDFYTPSAGDEKATNKNYKSVLRLVPNVKDVSKSKIQKFIYFFDTGTEKFYVDCPSNLDAKKKNIITEAYFATWKHDSATIREISKQFKRKPYFWCLALINEDKQHPELEGKIKIFRFGNQIDDLIVKQNEESPGKSKVNVFNPFTGKDLYLDIRNKKIGDNDQTMTTYEDSYFGENRTTIRIDGKNVEAKQENSALVQEFLQTNSPDLSQMEAKEWDADMENKVIETVRNLLAVDAALFNSIYMKVYGKPYFKKETSESGATTSTANVTATSKEAVKKEEKKDDVKATASTTNANKEELAGKLANKTEESGSGSSAAEAEDDFQFDLEDLPGE